MHAVKVYTTTKNTNFNYRTDLSSCACDRWSERGWTGGGIVRRSTIWCNPSGRQCVLQICKNFPAIRMLSRSKGRDTICIFFFFSIRTTDREEQLAMVFCRNCDWYIAARLFRCCVSHWRLIEETNGLDGRRNSPRIYLVCFSNNNAYKYNRF